MEITKALQSRLCRRELSYIGLVNAVRDHPAPSSTVKNNAPAQQTPAPVPPSSSKANTHGGQSATVKPNGSNTAAGNIEQNGNNNTAVVGNGNNVSVSPSPDEIADKVAKRLGPTVKGGFHEVSDKITISLGSNTITVSVDRVRKIGFYSPLMINGEFPITVRLQGEQLLWSFKSWDAGMPIEVNDNEVKIGNPSVDRKDLLKFSAFLRDEKELHPRTCWNKFSNVMSFLKAQGVRGLVKKADWPQYTEEEPEVYEREELDILFGACDADERLWFEFFLMTGEREQEVQYTYWSDVNLKASTVKVTYKPDRGWSPKAYKEREIPIPEKLVLSLQAAKAKRDKGCPLVFPTAGCRPKLNFLDDLKAVAERAGLKSENFFLHKFRATFATWHLWAGADLRTVQSWLGHSDMESTMRYLKPSRSQATMDRVNATFAAGGAQ
jgi:integrase